MPQPVVDGRARAEDPDRSRAAGREEVGTRPADRSSAETPDAGCQCMHRKAILMHMRTTLNIDDELLRQAREYTGIQEKTALVREALTQLIRMEASKRLIALGGTM